LIITIPLRPPPSPTLFPYTTLFRSGTYYWIASYGNDPNNAPATTKCLDANESSVIAPKQPGIVTTAGSATTFGNTVSDSATLSRSEEHTSELQSRFDLVCRLLLEKK